MTTRPNVRFKADPLAERKLESWPGLIPEIDKRVKAAEAVAIATAPIETGKYKESISSETGYDERAKVIGRLKSDDWKAHWIEFGTSSTPAYATLRRALDAIGLRVKVTYRSKKRRAGAN